MFLATGGKPYYLAGMFPVLLGGGSDRDRRVARARARAAARRPARGAVALSGVVSAVIALPILPAEDAGPVIAMNGDVGETIGWPEFTRTVAGVYRARRAGAVIFTSNYGEAGAIDRYGPALGLPAAYSGHNGFAEWGPPPDRPGPVVAVGLDASGAPSHFRGCRLAAADRQRRRRRQRRARRADRPVRRHARPLVEDLHHAHLGEHDGARRSASPAFAHASAAHSGEGAPKSRSLNSAANRATSSSVAPAEVERALSTGLAPRPTAAISGVDGNDRVAADAMANGQLRVLDLDECLVLDAEPGPDLQALALVGR